MRNGMKNALWRSCWLGVLALLMAMPMTMHAQSVVGKRLILKDGSYQGITQYEIKGERVRYFSSERNEWEEVPNSMVDWKATEAWNKADARPAVSPELKQLADEEKEEKEKELANTPIVAQGLRLPGDGGVFLLDDYKDQPQLAPLAQSGGELNKQTGKNILRAVINPIPTGSKQAIELAGAHAKVQSHTDLPEIYLNVAADSDDAPVDPVERYRLVQLVSKKNARIVQTIKIAIFGKVTEQQKYVQAKVERYSGDWVRMKPLKPLEPGEYAVVEMMGQNQINSYVWDFGVNFTAPPNVNAWKPVAEKETPPWNDKAPVLVPGKK